MLVCGCQGDYRYGKVVVERHYEEPTYVPVKQTYKSRSAIIKKIGRRKLRDNGL